MSVKIAVLLKHHRAFILEIFIKLILKPEKKAKLPLGPTAPRPGPTLLRVATTDVNATSNEGQSKEIRSIEIT